IMQISHIFVVDNHYNIIIINDSTYSLNLLELFKDDVSIALSKITYLEFGILPAIFLFILTKLTPNSSPTIIKEGTFKVFNFSFRSALLIAFRANINC